MTKVDDYRQTLNRIQDWIPFLLRESGLPGPRGNLELAYAVAEEGSQERFEQFLSFHAQENTPEVFLIFCGVVGLGRLAASQPVLFERLRSYASDPRWRVREAVATGLQLAGDRSMDLLLEEMNRWSKGNWYEKRAAAAALAEPRLLRLSKHVEQVLRIMDQITRAMQGTAERKSESFKVLRQAMGYCWSVAVVALPDRGKLMMEQWLASQNEDVRWVMKQNLKKNRLLKMDPDWVRACIEKLEQGT